MKKLVLYLFALLMVVSFVGCREVDDYIQPVVREEVDDEKEEPTIPEIDPDLRSLIERAFDDSEKIFNNTKMAMTGEFGSWNDKEILHDTLSMYTSFAKEYADNPTTWNAVLEYFRYDTLEDFADVFGFSEQTKAVKVKALKNLITQADTISVDALRMLLNYVEVYDSYLSEDGKDKIKMLLDGKISVKEPTPVYGQDGNITAAVDKTNNFYSLIMKTTQGEGDTTVYTLLYPEYYKWEHTSEASFSVPNKKSSDSQIVSSDSIVLKYGSDTLTSEKASKYPYSNSAYEFNFEVAGLPDGATVSCDVESENTSCAECSGNSGKVSFKNPGKYSILITVSPEETDTTHVKTVKEYSVIINSPYADLADRQLKKVEWAVITPLSAMMEESWSSDFSSLDSYIGSLISTKIGSGYKKVAEILYEQDQKYKFIYNGVSSTLVKTVNLILSLAGSSFKMQEIEGAKNILEKYVTINGKYYNYLKDYDNYGIPSDDSIVYSYLELFAPLYLKDSISLLNDLIGTLSLIKSNHSVLSEMEVDYSLGSLDFDKLYSCFTSENSIINKMLSEDMPYPYITDEMISSAYDDEKLAVAEFINLVNVLKNPSMLISSSSTLKSVNDFVDSLQAAMYYIECVYQYDKSTEDYQLSIPNTLSGVVNIVQGLVPELEFNINSDNLKVREIVDEAIADLKDTIRLDATTKINL